MIDLNSMFESENAQGASFLDKKGGNNDGLYRPKIGKDKKPYVAKLRFLPNLKKDGTPGLNGLEKQFHYVKIPTNPELNGYYDSQRGINGQRQCELGQLFWQFKKSKDVDDQDKADMIKLQTKYYSYVYIIEDKQQPELEGKVMIFPYTTQIANIIKEQANGDLGEPCDIFKLTSGKDFNLVIKAKGGGDGKNITYESSSFATNSTPFSLIDGTKFHTKDENGKLKIKPEMNERLTNLLLERPSDLEDFVSVEWSESQKTNFAKIKSIMLGVPVGNTVGSEVPTSRSSFDDFDDEEDISSTTSTKSEDEDEDVDW